MFQMIMFEAVDVRENSVEKMSKFSDAGLSFEFEMISAHEDLRFPVER